MTSAPPAIPDELPPAPPKPAQLTVDFFEEPDAIAVHSRRRSGAQGFLLLWLIGWTVGCVGVGVAVVKNPTLGTLAFAIPFWASWFAVAGFLVWLMFGKETLLIRADEALFLRTAFVKLSSRVVPRSEIRGFRECRSRHTENDQYLWGVEMVTLGKPLRFAFRVPDRERTWLIYKLNQFLGVEGIEESSDSSPSVSPSRRRGLSRSSKPSMVGESLNASNSLTEPPTDTHWQLVDEIESFSFWERGRLSIGSVALLVFLNAFWNGIVSVFVMGLFGLMPGERPPQGWEWWGLFVFLIPFEVIGLAMFAGLIMAIVEPFRRTEWRFEVSRIINRTIWPGYRHTRTWDVFDLDRIELRCVRDEDTESKNVAEATRNASGELAFQLAVISGENSDLCDIGALTEGEARWMAHVIRDRRPEWFGDPRLA